MLTPRNLKHSLLEAARSIRVVLVTGARQTGKSTLIERLFTPKRSHGYASMDDITTLAWARSTPKSFVSDLAAPAVIDEIQRVPELFLPIKQIVDAQRTPGRFFLTGSANVLTLPKLADSLAGRMGVYTLWPLSQGEIHSVQEDFVHAVFAEGKLKVSPANSGDSTAILHKRRTSTQVDKSTAHLLKNIVTGGYPDVVQMPKPSQRSAWFSGYLTSILERDVRELSNIEGLTAVPDLLELLASRAGGLLNTADLSRSLQLPASTLKRYLSLLQAVFMIVPLRAWATNLGKRLIKAPKLYLNDTGLLCHLLDSDEQSLEANRTLLGPVFENFVVMELVKQLTWSATRAKIFHFRSVTGQEVDIILEARGKIVGIECKASSQVSPSDFNGLRALKELTGKRFHRGIILYSGSQVQNLAEDLHLLPVSTLWTLLTKPAIPLE